MTNDEAINVLRNAAWLGTDADRKQIEEAVEMAINALTAQPEPSQAARDIATIIENEKDMRVIAQPETHEKRTETHGVCLDTIDRKAALDWLKNEWNGMVTSLFDGIKALPSAQPERKKGKWIEQEDWWEDVYYECSACGEPWTTIDGTPWDNGMKFCPNCGARMEDSE